MSKRLTHELIYDAPLADVGAMLADPAFREEVCAAAGVLRADVDVRSVDGVTEITVDQVQAARSIPSFAKKFVGDEINIVQKERWGTPDRGAVEVNIPGKPAAMKGTATLTEVGGVTTETFDLDISVGIPLVGGKIEGLIRDIMLRALTAENEVGRDYLSR